MKLKEILAQLPSYQCNDCVTSDMQINKIEIDHRDIISGDMFICIKGFTVDGHDFALEAVQKGAKVIVSEKSMPVAPAINVIVPDTQRALAIIANKFFDFPTQKMTLIGITGTNGKTTTTYLLEEIFNEANKKTGLIGTIQMKIGNETIETKNTTPDALNLQKTFHRMNEANVDVGIMEVSSHALELGRVYGCDFDVAVYTNLTPDHLDFHENMADYLEAKTLLFTGLGNSYSEKNKFAIVNLDDPHSSHILKRTMQPILTYGINQEADIRAVDIQLGINQTSFQVLTPNGNFTISSHLVGQFNIYNLLAAISVAIMKKIDIKTIKRALETVTGVNGRFEQVNIGQDYAVIVDYAHTPDSVENVLTTIKEFAQKKIYTVIGTGGDRDKTKRPLMAEAALSYSDYVIFTTDNPRTEAPEAILRDMTVNLTRDHYEVIVDRELAINKAIQLAKTGDIILLAGKGHETYQEINGVRYDFDDREVAKKAIIKRGI